MSLETKSLEFGEFILDLKEKALLRNGERLPINPKTFQLLVTLIEDPGHLIEKERLITKLWPDSFVEDANLPFTVSLLRKTLGDDPHKPRFIETVPRRGYRFIADVRERVNGNGSERPVTTVENGQPRTRPRLRRHLPAAAALLAVSVIGIGGLWYANERDRGGEAPILVAEFSSEQLSTDGKVRNAAVSPDGRSVAYTYASDGKESVWLRDLETSTNVQIIPPSENLYFELAVSPDGRSLYFARVQVPWPAGIQPDIYRVPIAGGIPAKVISQAQGSIGLSPDGTRISFRRCPYTQEEYCSLWISDVDGKNERRLVTRPGLIRIGDHEISPDGKIMAFAVGQSRNWSNDFRLAEVDLETGEERSITEERFFDIRRMVWLPGQRGLLITAKRYPDNNFRIWKVSTVTGQAVVLTNDAESYIGLSLNSNASLLISTKNRPDYHLNFYDPSQPADAPRVLSEASSVSFAPNGKILFSSAMTGNHEVWSINPDGSEQRQLTSDPGVDLNAVSSPDKSVIFFDSNRSGRAQLWRMKADGTEQQQLTYGDGGNPQAVSPDGKWVYFVSGQERKLMRVPSAGGEEMLVLDKFYPHHFAVSPDTSKVAFSESRDGKTVIVIISLADKKPLYNLEVPNERTGVVQTAWSADGNSLFYVAPDERSGHYFVWRQPLDGGSRVRIIDLGQEGLRETRSFAVSPVGIGFATIQGSWKHDAVLLKGLR